MPESVLDAIRRGLWDYEPEADEKRTPQQNATDALPGSKQKLNILANRIEQGLPLWHPQDRLSYEDKDEES